MVIRKPESVDVKQVNDEVQGESWAHSSLPLKRQLISAMMACTD